MSAVISGQSNQTLDVMFFSLVKVWILFDGFFLFDVPVLNKGFIWSHQICFSDLTCGFLFDKVFFINYWGFDQFYLFVYFWEISYLFVILIKQEVVFVVINVFSNVIHDDLWFFCWKAVLVRLSWIWRLNFALNEVSLCFAWFLLHLSDVIFFVLTLFWKFIKMWGLAKFLFSRWVFRSLIYALRFDTIVFFSWNLFRLFASWLLEFRLILWSLSWSLGFIVFFMKEIDRADHFGPAGTLFHGWVFFVNLFWL